MLDPSLLGSVTDLATLLVVIVAELRRERIERRIRSGLVALAVAVDSVDEDLVARDLDIDLDSAGVRAVVTDGGKREDDD